jgi:hypothetical protein
MDSPSLRRFVAAALAVTVTVLVTPVPVLSADPAVFRGKVLGADGVTPLSGVIVRLADNRSAAVYDSGPTGEDGIFRIETAPAGDYALLAKNDDVAYVAADSLTVTEGDNQPVSLTLTPGPPLAPAQTTQKELPLWGKILIGGVIAVAAIFIVNEIVSDDSELPASPFE